MLPTTLLSSDCSISRGFLGDSSQPWASVARDYAAELSLARASLCACRSIAIATTAVTNTRTVLTAAVVTKA